MKRMGNTKQQRIHKSIILGLTGCFLTAIPLFALADTSDVIDEKQGEQIRKKYALRYPYLDELIKELESGEFKFRKTRYRSSSPDRFNRGKLPNVILDEGAATFLKGPATADSIKLAMVFQQYSDDELPVERSKIVTHLLKSNCRTLVYMALRNTHAMEKPVPESSYSEEVYHEIVRLLKSPAKKSSELTKKYFSDLSGTIKEIDGDSYPLKNINSLTVENKYSWQIITDIIYPKAVLASTDYPWIADELKGITPSDCKYPLETMQIRLLGTLPLRSTIFNLPAEEQRNLLFHTATFIKNSPETKSLERFISWAKLNNAGNAQEKAWFKLCLWSLAQVSNNSHPELILELFTQTYSIPSRIESKGTFTFRLANKLRYLESGAEVSAYAQRNMLALNTLKTAREEALRLWAQDVYQRLEGVDLYFKNVPNPKEPE